MNSGTLKKISGSAIAVLAGCVFIVSGAAKLMPVEALEISLVDIGFANFKNAPLLARLMIGCEFALGFLLIFHFKLRRFTVPAAALLLIIFTIYILSLLKAYGNRGNCGCFGSVIEFTPLEGIIKNIVLLCMLAVAYGWAYVFDFRFKTAIAIVISLALIVLPYIINPMGYPFSKQPFKDFNRFAVDTALLYKEIPSPEAPVDIRQRKHVVAFLSVTCPHCRLAAKKLEVFKKQSPDFPVIFVLYNNKQKLREFFDDTKCDSIPHILLNSKEDFLRLTQGVFPRLLWVDNDTVVYETNYYLMDKNDIDKWLGKSAQKGSNQ